MMRILVSMLSVVAIGMVGAACSSDGGVEDETWVLSELAGSPVAAGFEATFTFDGTDIAGSGGCNRYQGKASFDNGSVDVSGPLAVTMMACGEETDAAERRFLQVLEEATSYSVDDDTLTLSDADDLPLATFNAEA